MEFLKERALIDDDAFLDLCQKICGLNFPPFVRKVTYPWISNNQYLQNFTTDDPRSPVIMRGALRILPFKYRTIGSYAHEIGTRYLRFIGFTGDIKNYPEDLEHSILRRIRDKGIPWTRASDGFVSDYIDRLRYQKTSERIVRKRCIVDGKLFTPITTKQVTCSDACSDVKRRASRARYRLANKAEIAKRNREQRRKERAALLALTELGIEI